MNYAHEQKITALREERQQIAARARHEMQTERENEAEKAAQDALIDLTPAAIMQGSKENFFKSIAGSNDLEDNLQELVDFI